jgi:hypothetical protein
MIQNQIKAFVRSVTPFVESSIVGYIAHRFFHKGNVTAAEIAGVGGVFLSAALHWLEIHFPWVGVFLGWIGLPAYAPSAKAQLSDKVAQLQSELDALKTPQSAPEAPVAPATIEATGSATLSAEGSSVA